jgi:hypothetical protein
VDESSMSERSDGWIFYFCHWRDDQLRLRSIYDSSQSLANVRGAVAVFQCRRVISLIMLICIKILLDIPTYQETIAA